MRLSDDNIRGRTIIAADGKVVGEIAVLFVDCKAWRMESLQMKLVEEYEQRKTRIERDLRDSKLRTLSGVPLGQDRPA